MGVWIQWGQEASEELSQQLCCLVIVSQITGKVSDITQQQVSLDSWWAVHSQECSWKDTWLAIYSWLVLRRPQLILISQKHETCLRLYLTNHPGRPGRVLIASTGTQLRRMSLAGCLAGAEPSTADLEQQRRGVEWNGRIPKIERYLQIFLYIYSILFHDISLSVLLYRFHI